MKTLNTQTWCEVDKSAQVLRESFAFFRVELSLFNHTKALWQLSAINPFYERNLTYKIRILWDLGMLTINANGSLPSFPFLGW
jgi:hypothetical protein